MTKLLIGIDGGGTGCRAIVANASGIPLGRGSAGSANIMSNFALARNNILSAAKDALHDAGCDQNAMSTLHAVLGLAGANVGDYQHRLLRELPFQESHIESDGLIALEGAHGSGDGAIAVLGTGSVFLHRSAGVVRSFGGWGHIVSDHGSGAWLGKRLLQETLLSYDGVVASGELTHQLLDQFQQNPQEIIEFAHSASAADFAAFAPQVFEFSSRGDHTALLIVKQALADIERLLDTTLTSVEMKLSLLGGLGSLYEPCLSARFQSRIQPAKADATNGAVSMAKRRYSQ